MAEQEEGSALYDAEAQAQTQRSRCSSWRLVLAITLPYVVLTAFMAVTVYTSKSVTPPRHPPTVHEDMKKADIFIQFAPITDIYRDEVLSFKYFDNNQVSLVDHRFILVPCNGPYLLHAYVCSQGLDGGPGAGRLELRLPGGPRAGLAALPLESGARVTCKGLQASVYLRKKDRATLQLTSPDQNLRVKNITLGLQYLLGQCQF